MRDSAMLRRGFLVAVAVLVAGCASTTLRDAWYDNDYKGGPFKRVLVLGVSNNAAERRTFEDIIVARLTGLGVQAVPAYRYLPDGARASEAQLDEAVRASGADALMMSRVRAIDRRTSVQTAMVPGYGRWGYYGWYSGWYPMTEVNQYDVAMVETSVFSAGAKQLVWAGQTETFDPRSVARDAPGFADVIIKALQSHRLLPPPKA